jgi:hypothetical protein
MKAKVALTLIGIGALMAAPQVFASDAVLAPVQDWNGDGRIDSADVTRYEVWIRRYDIDPPWPRTPDGNSIYNRAVACSTCHG